MAQLLDAPQLQADLTRQPIRVKIDTTYIDTANPEGLSTCQKVGQEIKWGSTTVTCVEGDLWTKEKMEVIKGTFANVEKYLESTLKVFRIGPWAPERGNPMYPVPLEEEKVTDADLYVVLYPRPYGEGSNILASALYLAADDIGRPMQGCVTLNLAAIPKKVQDVSTVGDRGFFEVALHEMCHVLGISEPFTDWRNVTVEGTTINAPKYTGEIMYTMTTAGKKMTILHTPKLHALMAERLGFEYFYGRSHWPVGVEIEDGGGIWYAGAARGENPRVPGGAPGGH